MLSVRKTWFAILASVGPECDLYADLLISEPGPQQYCIVRVRELRALHVIMRPENPANSQVTFSAFSTIEMGIFAWCVHVYLRNSAMLIFTA